MSMAVKTERQWQQEEDARTLAAAEQIKQDPNRLTAAQEAAKRMLAEREKETAGLRSVAGRPAKSEKAPVKVAGGFVLPRIQSGKK